jgi:hypothetical protein
MLFWQGGAVFAGHQIRLSLDRMRASHPAQRPAPHLWSPRGEWRRFTIRVVMLMALFWAGLFALVSAELLGEWPLMIAILLVIPAISYFQRRWTAPPGIAQGHRTDRYGAAIRSSSPVAGNDP